MIVFSSWVHSNAFIWGQWCRKLRHPGRHKQGSSNKLPSHIHWCKSFVKETAQQISMEYEGAWRARVLGSICQRGIITTQHAQALHVPKRRRRLARGKMRNCPRTRRRRVHVARPRDPFLAKTLPRCWHWFYQTLCGIEWTLLEKEDFWFLHAQHMYWFFRSFLQTTTTIHKTFSSTFLKNKMRETK